MAIDNAKVEIELLKKDVAMITNLCAKFDVTIDKMQDIASNLSKLISLQEQRLETQERTTKDVHNTLEMRRLEHNSDIKEIHSRITTTNRELTEKIEETEKKILEELQSMKQALMEDKNNTGKKILDIEAWKYMLSGGILVAVWLLARADGHALLKLLFGG